MNIDRVLREYIKREKVSYYFRMVIHVDPTTEVSVVAPVILNRRSAPSRDINDTPPPVPPDNARTNGVAEIVDFPDVDPQFPGGSLALKQWIQDNIQYPEISKELGDQGQVYVTFIVELNGSISKVQVMRGGVTDELNREAKRIIRNMPKWTPGENKGMPVRSRCRLPVTFKL